VTTKVEQVVVLLLQSVDDLLVLLGYLFDAFYTQVLDALRFVDDFNQFFDLLQTLRERVELAEYVILAVIWNYRSSDVHRTHI